MVVLYLALQILVSVLLAVILGLGFGIIHGAGGHTVDQASVVRWMHSPNILTGLTVVTVLIVATFMLWLIHRYWPAQWRVADPPGFGFVKADGLRFFVYAVVIGLCVAFLGGFLTRLLAHGHAVHQNVTVMGEHVTLGMRVALAVVVVCVAPIVEELIFRGVLLSGLMRYMSAGRAIAISAVIFGCMHLPDFGYAWYPIPALVILGALLAWIRLRSHSLWPAITMHATNNLVAVILWFAVANSPHA